MGTVRLRHGDHITAVAFTPNGAGLYSAGNDNGVRLWDLSTGRSTVLFKGHKELIFGIALSEDGKLLASRSNGSLRIWDPSTGEERWNYESESPPIKSMAFSPDSRTIAVGLGTGADDSILILDAARGRRIKRIETSCIADLSFMEGGRWIVSKNYYGNPWAVHDVREGTIIEQYEGEGERICGMAACPDRGMVALVDSRGSVCTGRIQDGKETVFIPAPEDTLGGRVQVIAFSRDGRLLATASTEGPCQVWDVETKKSRTLEGSEGPSIRECAFSRDGTKIAAATLGEGRLRIWDVPTGKELYPPSGHPGGVSGVALSPDGNLLASLSGGSCWLWKTRDGTELRQWKDETGTASGVVFPPDGKQLATRSRDGFRIYDVGSGKRVLDIGIGHHLFSLSMAFDREVPKADPDLVKRLPSLRQTMLRDESGITFCEWFRLTIAHPPGRNRMVSNFPDGTLRLWEVSTGKEIHKVSAGKDVRALAFSPDGSFYVSGHGSEWVRDGNGEIRFWEAATGRPMGLITVQNGGVICLEFSPDGKLLASGGRDPIVRLWDAHSLLLQREFRGHEGEVCNLAFSGDGRLLASASSDTTVLVWDVPR